MNSFPLNNQLIRCSDHVDISNRLSGPILWKDLSPTICFLVLKEMREIHHQLKTEWPWTPPGCNVWSGFSATVSQNPFFFLLAEHRDSQAVWDERPGASHWPQLTIKPHHTLDGSRVSHPHPNGDLWSLCLWKYQWYQMVKIKRKPLELPVLRDAKETGFKGGRGWKWLEALCPCPHHWNSSTFTYCAHWDSH